MLLYIMPHSTIVTERACFTNTLFELDKTRNSNTPLFFKNIYLRHSISFFNKFLFLLVTVCEDIWSFIRFGPHACLKYPSNMAGFHRAFIAVKTCESSEFKKSFRDSPAQPGGLLVLRDIVTLLMMRTFQKNSPSGGVWINGLVPPYPPTFELCSQEAVTYSTCIALRTFPYPNYSSSEWTILAHTRSRNSRLWEIMTMALLAIF